jgi:hypothetical protein
MFQRFHLPGVGVICGPDRRRAIKKWLFRRFLRLRTLKTAYVIDETLKSYVEQSFSAVAAKVRFMPDPSVPIVKVARESARQMLALPSDACLILVYGSIDVRKDVPTLLAWAASCAGRRQVHVLLAGLVKDDVKQALDSEPAAILEGQGRLWKIPRYIDPHEESAVFSASDIVWLAYDNVESLSGVMVKAALFEKTILFRNYGLMGRYAMQFGSQVADRSSSVIDECTLPPGIELRVFGQNSPVPLPNHSWHNACQLIFDA